MLAMHHPPLAVGIPSMDQYALRNADDFWSVIAPHRQRIRHILLGHLHRPIGGSWRGIPISCTHSPNHQVALDLVSRPPDGAVPGCQETASFSVILIDEESVVVHHQSMDESGERFLL
jgi:3',5'-cyclic AMP phosphodiesterase CpdA